MSLICSAKAMRALHRVLVCARFEACEGRDPKTLGDVMDTAEYLVAILQNHEDRSKSECLGEFRAFFAGLGSPLLWIRRPRRRLRHRPAGSKAGKAARSDKCVKCQNEPAPSKEQALPHPRFTNEEIVRRGEKIYAARLRNQLENLYHDRIVIIDIETGEYEVDDDALTHPR